MRQYLEVTGDTTHAPFDLRKAIESNELALRYQPIFDLSDGSIFAVEALVRWRPPHFGELAPGAFLHQLRTRAEQRALDLWVLENALLDLSMLDRSARQPLVLNVNACARHFDSAQSAAAFANVIGRTGFDPKSVVIELTETYALNDPVRAAEHIERLRRLGVRFAIDDFGTGCATLEYFARLPVDFLKIDRSFAAALHEKKTSAIIEALASLAQRFGIDVVLEGIERPEQLRFASSHHVPFGQGYLFARPLLLEELHEVLETPPGHRLHV